MIVRVTARAIFPNCPRYIPKMQLAEPSVYVPQPAAIRSSPRGRLRPVQRVRAPKAADRALKAARDKQRSLCYVRTGEDAGANDIAGHAAVWLA